MNPATNEDKLNQALDAINAESVPQAEVDAARARVWEKLMASTGANCSGFRSQLQAYAEARLSGNQRVLLEDHLARCPECRRAFAELRGERKVVAMPQRHTSVLARYRGWAIAASVALVALYAGRTRIDDLLAPSGPRATIVTIAGQAHRLPEGSLKPGQTLAEGDILRTEPGARAVLRLADGSTVEVNERTELWVHAAWSGQTVHLNRGDVIVEAAKQKRGRLMVATRDTTASVKGTVFAVSTGLTGSLVSVLEGSVEVARPGATSLVTPGHTAASNPALEGVSVKQTVAWSPNSEKYFTLLGEFATLEKKLAALPGAPLRTQATLLASLPPGVTVYAAAPNLNDTIRQAVRLAEERAGESSVFHEWWTSESSRQLRAAVDQLQGITPLLGDEIVFAFARNGQERVPLMLAAVKPGSREALQQALTRLLPGGEVPGFYRLTDSQLAFSDSAAHLQWATSNAGQFAASPFAAEIAAHYQRGAGWLVALDTASLHDAPATPALNSGVRYVFFEQRATAAGEENEALLAFNGPRTGFASWLAPAGASGAAEYISSEAAVVFSASTREPRQLFDEILAQISRVKPGAADELKKAEEKLGVSIGNDLAASLGTDFAIAVERPAIPIPGWVAAVEVYKPSTLDAALRRMVDAFNAEQSSSKLQFVQETANGRTWSSIRAGVGNVSITWTHHAGYMVAGADRALVERAIATREGGSPLIRTANFTGQMPASTGVHPSGFVWVNVQGALADAVKLLPYPALQSLVARREPVLVAFNGETERIRAASRTRLTSLVLDSLLAGGAAAGDAGKDAKAQLKKTSHASASH